ncbi:MAG: hypothetical protein Q9211_005624 [Gyalolechia sp. 1 TL-2023]
MGYAQPPPGSGPPPGLSIPSTQNFDRLGDILIGVSVLVLVLCTVAVAGRLVARRFVKVALEADDFVALLAWFLLAALTAEQCSPHSIDRLWLDPTKCRQGPRHSKTGTSAPTIGGFVNALVDVYVLLLPIKMVWNLKMTNKRKILVCGLFSLGLLGVAVSIARAIALLHIDANPGMPEFLAKFCFERTDGITDSISIALFCWSTAEAAVALICACLPMQRPLFSHIYEILMSPRGAQKLETCD